MFENKLYKEYRSFPGFRGYKETTNLNVQQLANLLYNYMHTFGKP